MTPTSEAIEDLFALEARGRQKNRRTEVSAADHSDLNARDGKEWEARTTT